MPCGPCRGKGHFNLGASEGPDNGYRSCHTCYGKGYIELVDPFPTYGQARSIMPAAPLSDEDVDRIVDRVVEKLEQRRRVG